MPNTKCYRQKISLFGHFGAGNFGNESTLQAMLCHLRRMTPDAEISCICSAPEIVSADYKIAAVPIRGITVKPWNLRNPVARLARKLFIGIPSELYRWLEGVITLRDADMLIVVGTGLLTDAFGVRGWGPYGTFKWSVIAKLCRCRLLFVSVGAGPLEHRTGRLFVKSALSLANFRSYRDEATLEYLKGIGFRPNGDRVYPDLAFSLTAPPPNRNAEKGHRLVVGIGLMSHDGMYGIDKTTSAHYAAYLETLVVFVKWLLEHEYDIRLLSSDLMDMAVVREFNSLLRARSVTHEEKRIMAEPVASTDEVLSQLAATDFVVATRFHNVLLALLLNKPSIAISFHHKCSSLMSQMGLSEYCQDINRLNVNQLIEQFCDLEKNADRLRPLIKDKAGEFRRELDEQYNRIFKEMFPDCFPPMEGDSLRTVDDGMNSKATARSRCELKLNKSRGDSHSTMRTR
jgi:polysaccharide pyruvyl transferase WcaK-like protein